MQRPLAGALILTEVGADDSNVRFTSAWRLGFAKAVLLRGRNLVGPQGR